MIVNTQIYFFIIIIFLTVYSSSVKAKRILIIESYHIGYSWDRNYVKGISEVLKGHDIVRFEMDTKRISKSKFKERARLAWVKFLNVRPDVVILGDDNAVNLLKDRFAKTDIPVVFLGVNTNPRDYDILKYSNFTGVLERPLFRRTIKLIEDKTNLKTPKILILFDNSITSKKIIESNFKNKYDLKISNSRVTIKKTNSFVEYKKNIITSKRNGHDFIIIGLFHTLRCDNNNHIPSDRLLSWLMKNSPLPPFGFWSFVVGKSKMVGGVILDAIEHGRDAGKLVKAILDGKKISEIPIKTTKKGIVIFDKNRFESWGESKLNK